MVPNWPSPFSVASFSKTKVREEKMRTWWGEEFRMTMKTLTPMEMKRRRRPSSL